MSRSIWFVCLCALPLAGQGLHFGVAAGVPLTQYFETGASGGLHGSAVYSAATRRYTVGVSGEWDFAESWGLEIDALYHRMGYVAIVNFFDSANGNFSDSAVDVKGNSWDFPVMARYRIPHAGGLFVAGGGAMRYIGPVRGLGTLTAGSLVTRTSATSNIDTTEPSELRKRFYPGVTAMGGVVLPAGRVRITPEVRYTRWTANIGEPGPQTLLRFASNQVEVVVGVGF